MRILQEKKTRNIIILLLSLVLLLNSAYANANWWNSDYAYRQQINITNTDNLNPIVANYSINVSLDTADLYSNNKALANCFDIRVVYWNRTENIELSRDIENGCNSEDSMIWFNLQENIDAGQNNLDYYIYYANPSANAPSKLGMLVDFDDYPINSYEGSQDANPAYYEYLDGGYTLHMWRNNWKAITKSITIGSNTIIELDFKSNGSTGEINAIGLDTDLGFSENWNFQLFGTQGWGLQTYHTYTPNNWQHFLIDINNQYTGSFNYITFANDADSGQATNVYFKNIKIREYMVNEPKVIALSELAYDVNRPSITLNYPVDNYNTTLLDIDFSFNAVDETSTTLNCSLYIDSEFIDLNNSVNNGTDTTISTIGLSEGTHNWSISCIDQESNVGESPKQNFVIDLTKPEVIDYALTPGNDDDIDANTQINISINMSDSVAIDTVIFQYKAFNETEWNNDYMDYDSNMFVNASFIPTFNGTWQYRTWSNDTLGNSGHSDVVELSVQSDWSWTYSPIDFGTKSAQLNTNATIGTLIINNTGDHAMTFDLSSDWKTASGEEKLYYNESEPISLDAKQVKYINVTASASDTQRSDYISITIDCLNSSALPSLATSNFTMISYVSGPYLYSKIYTHPETITHSSSGNSLSAYVINLGNETAEDVYLVWSLPNGSSSEYSFNVSLGNISVGEKKWSNITFELNYLAPIGEKTISIYVESSNNASSSDSKDTTISCNNNDNVCGQGCSYLNDEDCDQEVVVYNQGGGGASSREISEIESTISEKEILSSSKSIDIVRGSTDSFMLKVENIYSTAELKNVELTIDGFYSRYLKIEPSIIEVIGPNELKEFNVTITSPEYLEKGKHNLKMTITAKKVSLTQTKNFIETINLELNVHTISKEDANISIELANSNIIEMDENGFSSTKVSHLLYEAKKALKNEDYETTKNICDEIALIKEQAFEAKKTIKEIEQKIEDYENSIVNEYDSLTGAFTGTQNTGLYESRTMLDLARAAFERGDYTTALSRLEDTEMTISLESNEITPISFVLKNWSALFVSSILFFIFSTLGYKQYARLVISDKINDLKNEEDIVRKHMTELQRKRFKEKSIGPDTFEKSYKHKKQKLSDIQNLRIKLRNKRIRLLKVDDVLKELYNEMKDIEKSMKNVQKLYFAKGKISREDYKESSKLLNERIAEIEDEKMTLHIQKKL